MHVSGKSFAGDVVDRPQRLARKCARRRVDQTVEGNAGERLGSAIEAADHALRVEHDDDDAVIAALIAAARGHVEALSRRALLVQRWRVVLDAWPAGGRLDPRIGPLRSVIAARVFDAANNAHSIDAATFVVDAAANIIASPCWALPLPGRTTAGI